ncbi:MAG TPA: phosphate signaling complex protein PhoU [Steroidobacteraceae bacterium]
MLEGHISKAFDGAMAALHMRVLEMGGLALDQVREAIHAYTELDVPAAKRVIERERTINAYDVTLDEEQLTLIARRAPVASDLRAIIAMSKAVGEFERVGDEAKKIAKTVLTHVAAPSRATSGDVLHLGRLALNLLSRALEAFDRLDGTAASDIIAGDKQIDAEYAAGLRRLLTRAMEDPRDFAAALEAAFILKSLERVGDHARNLARLVRAMFPAALAPGSAPTSSVGG